MGNIKKQGVISVKNQVICIGCQLEIITIS